MYDARLASVSRHFALWRWAVLRKRTASMLGDAPPKQSRRRIQLFLAQANAQVRAVFVCNACDVCMCTPNAPFSLGCSWTSWPASAARRCVERGRARATTWNEGAPSRWPRDGRRVEQWAGPSRGSFQICSEMATKACGREGRAGAALRRRGKEHATRSTNAHTRQRAHASALSRAAAGQCRTGQPAWPIRCC